MPTSNCETFPISNFEPETGEEPFTLTDGVYASKLLERYVSQEEKDSNYPLERQNTGYMDNSESGRPRGRQRLDSDV